MLKEIKLKKKSVKKWKIQKPNIPGVLIASTIAAWWIVLRVYFGEEGVMFLPNRNLCSCTPFKFGVK